MSQPFLGICAIVKNEGPYILEWLTYHRAIGVERFTIFHNGSTDDTLEQIARFGGPVDVIEWPGEAPQVRAYRDMLANRRHYAEWVAFIDVDEFLTPRGDELVPALLRALPADVGTLYAHWLCFGSSGQVERQPGFVTERFQTRGPEDWGPNHYGKSIVRMDSGAELKTPHLIVSDMRAVNTRGEDIELVDGKQGTPSHVGLALHHYFTKSREEWIVRRAQGRPALPKDHPDSIRGMDQFHSLDRNDVHDDTAARITTDLFSPYTLVGNAPLWVTQEWLDA